MHVVPGIDALEPSLGRLFVVVGVFDGLHRGHLYLLDALGRAAADRGAKAAVVTFDHHPDEILTGSAPPLLCDPLERLERLEDAGVEVTVVQHFDVALRETSYDGFIRRIAERVEIAGFLMTPDSSFGYRRGGTPETVAELGREMGYDVVVIPPFELDGQPVKSADIRASIAAGNLAEAGRLLGRPYSIVGRRRGSSSDRTGDRDELEVAAPVALPPAATYEVRIDEVAESTPGDRPRGERRGRITIDEVGKLVVDGLSGPGRRLRVVFDAPGDRAEPPGGSMAIARDSRHSSTGVRQSGRSADDRAVRRASNHRTQPEGPPSRGDATVLRRVSRKRGSTGRGRIRCLLGRVRDAGRLFGCYPPPVIARSGM